MKMLRIERMRPWQRKVIGWSCILMCIVALWSCITLPVSSLIVAWVTANGYSLVVGLLAIAAVTLLFALFAFGLWIIGE